MSFRFAKFRLAFQSVAKLWNAFFFAPQSATPLALYRIIYGLLITADLVLLHGDWLTWFGPNGLVSLETLRSLSPNAKPNLIWAPLQYDICIQGFFWIFLLFAVFLTFGFLSRLSSMMVFICLGAIIQRNGYITNGSDYLLRFTGFFLMLAPSGAAISVDRLLRIWRGQESIEAQPCWPWAQRMIQIQTAMLYVSAFCWKTVGSDWRDGTALYYTTRLLQFQRFPMPTLENGLALRLATWSSLFIEFAMGVLVWVRKLRYWILLSGVCLHLSIEYSMNVPLFEWVAMAGYVTFIDPGDLSRMWAWVRRRFDGGFGQPVDVIYDGCADRSLHSANVLRAIDIFGRLNFIDRHSAEGRAGWPDLSNSQGKMLFVSRASAEEGFSGLVAISPLVPLLWWLAPVSVLSGRWKHALPALKAAK